MFAKGGEVDAEVRRQERAMTEINVRSSAQMIRGLGGRGGRRAARSAAIIDGAFQAGRALKSAGCRMSLHVSNGVALHRQLFMPAFSLIVHRHRIGACGQL